METVGSGIKTTIQGTGPAIKMARQIIRRELSNQSSIAQRLD